jgi:hypothetical protein
MDLALELFQKVSDLGKRNPPVKRGGPRRVWLIVNGPQNTHESPARATRSSERTATYAW